MSTDAFNQACDRLVMNLDPGGFEARRWAKNEGAKLDQVAELIKQAFDDREDISVVPVPSSMQDVRGFTLHLGANSVVRLNAKLQGNRINIWAVEVDGGIADVPSHGFRPASVELVAIDLETVADAVANVLLQIRS